MPEESRNSPIRVGSEALERPCCSSGQCEVRCGCGSLLARVVDGAVELKCRRCKRTWNIPLQQ